MRINCAGRLGGAEIARRLMMHEGQVPLHTFRADVDYGVTEARTVMGRIGIKVWIYKGDILPEAKIVDTEAVAPTPLEATPVVEPPTAEPAVELQATEVTEPLKNVETPDANSHIENEGSDNASTQPG